MSDLTRVMALLKRHVGFHFCAFCIARELSLESFDVRGALRELEASAEYEMRTIRCVSCGRSKRVIAAVGGFAVLGPEAHVIAFLLGNKGLAFCDACLALANEISLEDSRRVVTLLEPLPEFAREQGECSVCGRASRPVIAAVASTDDTALGGGGTDGLASISSSTVHHRGWRVDLLSYKMDQGWRPFVVIHDSDGDVVPEAASLWDPLPTAAEADDYARLKAQEWIDKRC